jgi:hypothetical protein
MGPDSIASRNEGEQATFIMAGAFIQDVLMFSRYNYVSDHWSMPSNTDLSRSALWWRETIMILTVKTIEDLS